MSLQTLQADGLLDESMQNVSLKSDTVTPTQSVKMTTQSTRKGNVKVSPASTTQGVTKMRSEVYERKDELEHMLALPDTFVGSVEPTMMEYWVPETTTDESGTDTTKMVTKVITIVPALFKIFDEILVNAADNTVARGTDTIKVTIGNDGVISVWNNGLGIPVEEHPKEKIWTPELIFGHLRTSSNYNTNDQRLVGGRNGFGAKLANIWSKEFTIETFDHIHKLRYRQSWSDNMRVCEKPTIRKVTSLKTDYTQLTFLPDYARFSLPNGIDQDHRDLFIRRVYDLAGTITGVKVHLNGTRITGLKTFKDYVNMFVPNEGDICYEKVNDRWEVAVVGHNGGQFLQTSFVNNISTNRGGAHVDVLVKQITDAVIDKISKTTKTSKDEKSSLKALTVKNNMWIFINCRIVNASFDSQTKEYMTRKPSDWGSRCDLSANLIKKILASAVTTNTMEAVQMKQDALMKKTDGSKKTRILGIPKLTDANWAGTRKSSECILFLTEGDSAKSTAIAGISAVPNGYNKFGVYPLRGKVLNVRDASVQDILKNKELNELKQILGLQKDKVYTTESVRSLRYSRVALFTDADNDGAHIKGLIINFFDHFYPSLLKVPGFLTEFITPIVKCTKRGVARPNASVSFYSQQDYTQWKTEMSSNELQRWHIKFYKGLGTSGKDEAKDYFRNIISHLKTYKSCEAIDREAIDMAFNKKRAIDRKTWLKTYDKEVTIDKTYDHSVSDFVHKELIHFSNYDNIRSIPRLVDGLKPSQRKVLWSLFKKPQKDEIRVAQLAPRVAEMTAYHHGEVSLVETIKKLAQDFTGSNNVNLLVPSGQFGTRLKGGEDGAAARYIYTMLQPYTRLIFRESDDPILELLEDDGIPIEPKCLLPIIPMVLVNGAKGIGSGYSTDVLSYNPMEIIDTIRAKLASKETTRLVPYWRGFTGTVTENVSDTSSDDTSLTYSMTNSNKWLVRGTWTLSDDNKTIKVTELPVGTWTYSYKDKVVEPMSTSGAITEYKEYHTDECVYFDITSKDAINPITIPQVYKLEDSFRTSNMVLFDKDMRLRSYNDVSEIINEYFEQRLEAYHTRKEYQLKSMQHELTILHNKVRFIRSIIGGEYSVHKKSREQIHKELHASKYTMIDGTFDYLLGMALWSLTQERVTELETKFAKKQHEYDDLKKTLPSTIWLRELEELEAALKKDAQERAYNSAAGERSLSASSASAGGSSGKGTRVAKIKSTVSSKRRTSSDDSDKSSLQKSAKRVKLVST